MGVRLRMQMTGLSKYWNKHHVVAHIPVEIQYNSINCCQRLRSACWMEGDIKHLGFSIGSSIQVHGENEMTITIKKKFLCTHIKQWCELIRTVELDGIVNQLLINLT